MVSAVRQSAVGHRGNKQEKLNVLVLADPIDSMSRKARKLSFSAIAEHTEQAST